MKTVFKTFFCLLLIAGLGSCKSQKDYLYLADMTDDQGYAITQRFQPKVQRDDRLKITVSCKNPELAVPFNVTPGTLKVSENGKVGGSTTKATSTSPSSASSTSLASPSPKCRP